MSEPVRMATQRVFLWRAASWLSAVFALLALLLPLTGLLAASLVALTLALGFPTYKSNLQQGWSRRITVWWLGLSVASILALLVKLALWVMPFPRYSDYLPREHISPLRQAILDNASVISWGAGWTSVVTTVAGVVVLGWMFQQLPAVRRQRAIFIYQGSSEF